METMKVNKKMRNKNRVGVNDIIVEVSDEDYDLDADGIYYVPKKQEKAKERKRRGSVSTPMCMRRKEVKMKDRKNWVSNDGGVNL